MTTPTFRDWAEMYERASWEFIEYDDVWSEEFLLYILSRIERKEKALREELKWTKGNVMLAVSVQQNDERAFDAERSRIAERGRRITSAWYVSGAEFRKELEKFFDDIEEGKV